MSLWGEEIYLKASSFEICLWLSLCPPVIVNEVPELRPPAGGKSMQARERAVRSNHLGQRKIFLFLFSSEKRILK